jgi:hypothetical protein
VPRNHRLGASALLGLLLGCGGNRASNAPQQPAVPAGPTCEAAFESYLAESAFSGTHDTADRPPVEAYAKILDYGAYFSHCNPPDKAEISICAAVQNGRARGVTVATAPSSKAVESCIDRAVRGLRFPPHGKLEVARTFFPAAGTPVWGLPRPDPRAESTVRDFVANAAEPEGGAARASSLCAPTLVVMQRLWDALTEADPGLEARGIETRFAPRFEPDALRGQGELSMRVFDGAAEVEAVLRSPAVAALAARLRTGTLRTAEPKERELAYKLQMVAFAPNASVTVVTSGSDKLAVLVSEGRVYWLELLSAWEGVSPAPAPPPPAPVESDAGAVP